MKKFFCIFISIIIAFSAIGCKGTKQEVEKIGLVLAIGYDLTQDNRYKLTMQVLNPEKETSTQGMASNKTGQQISSEVMVYSSIGDTPYDALNHLSIDYGRNLFLGHSEYLVFGKKLAESGLALSADTIMRGQQARPDSTLLVAENTASEILEFMPTDEKIPATSVKNLVKMQSTRGFSVAASRLGFINALSSGTDAPVLGVIAVNQKDNAGTAFRLAGTDVFKKDKLIGYLNMNETRGMQWIKGRVKDGVIASYYPDNKKISFFLLSASSEIKPIAVNDSVAIQVNIKAESNVIEMPVNLDPMKNPNVMDDLAKLQSDTIKNEAKLALIAAQKKYDADIFDFSGAIHRDYPKMWKKIEGNWDSIFPNIKVEVNVVSAIHAPGVIGKPTKK